MVHYSDHASSSVRNRASPLPSTTDRWKRALRASRSSLAITNTARRQRRGDLRPNCALAAPQIPKPCNHLVAGLCDVCRTDLPLRRKPEAGSPLSISRDAEIANEW